MSKVYLISDLHFGHKNMAQHRGFQDEFYQDEEIVKNWNNVITKKDTVYILGDITMENSKHYYRLDELNGTKIVVLGNHDLRRDVPELLKYVSHVAGVINYKGFVLSHIPVHPKELYDNAFKVRWRGNIHGHVHENTLDDNMYFNVSCENINYTPIEFTEIVKIFEDRKKLKI